VKLAVIGGGSTYTPELADGIGRLLPSRPASWSWSIPTPGGWPRSGPSRPGSWPRTGIPPTCAGPASLDDGADGADAILFQLRIGGQAARQRDETWPLDCGCVGQETTGAGRPGQGAPHRTHCPGFGRTGPPPGFALSLHHRLHQPGGDRHPGAAVRRAPRRRPVQRGDRVPARLRLPARRPPDAGVPGPRRPEPPDLGTLGAGGRGGRAARTAGHPRGRDRVAHRDARGLRPAPGHGALVLPALLLRPRRGGRRAARRGHPRRGSGPAGGRAAELYADPALDTKPPSWLSAAARGTPRRRWTCSPRCAATGATSQVVNTGNGRRCRSCPPTR
jgi:hypothetical protein